MPKTHEPIFLPGGKTRLLIALVSFTALYIAFHSIVAALTH
jgi:hypothetical protein